MKRWLDYPLAYDLFTRLIGRKNAKSVLVTEYVRPIEGDRVLDIGCGTGRILDFLPAVTYYGFDTSRRYIEAAVSRFGDRGHFERRRITRDAVEQLGSFDIALAIGVLHHLDDTEALDLFELARTALKPTGRLITFDGCFDERQSRLSRLIVGSDRGRYVRPASGYDALARQAFPDVAVAIRHDLLAVPYAHAIMVCGRGPH